MSMSETGMELSVLPPDLDQKYTALRERLSGMGSVLVAYSGGADSALLARVAHDVLGDRAAAVTAVSASLAGSERRAAADLARSIGIRHHEVTSHEIEDADYVRNAPDRCFHCKKELFSIMARKCREMGMRWSAYGAVTDDLGDVRPGMQAAESAGVVAPLLDAGIGKENVRTLSRHLSLPTWNKPASPCLASRVPHGTPVRIELLRRVEKLEAYLHQRGFSVCRVRVEGEGARIEVEPRRVAELEAQLSREELTREARRAGFLSVSVDPRGYRKPGTAPTLPIWRS